LTWRRLEAAAAALVFYRSLCIGGFSAIYHREIAE
jgi:hypothetical protein